MVPFGLALALLVTILAASLAPNAGVGAAAVNCTYGQCPSSPTFPVWAVTSALAVVVVALLLAVVLARRRRPGAPGGPSPTEGSDAEAPAPGPNGPTDFD